MESRAESLRKRAFLGAIPDDFLRVSSSSREEPRLHPISYPGGPVPMVQPGVQRPPYLFGAGYENIAGKLTVTVNQVFIIIIFFVSTSICTRVCIRSCGEVYSDVVGKASQELWVDKDGPVL